MEELHSWDISSFNRLSESTLLQNAVERALQVSIEVMIDVCERILALSGLPPARSSSEAISRIQDLGILSRHNEYVDLVRFRNFIVHRYERIDLEIIYSILDQKLFLFHDFVKEVRGMADARG